MPTTRLPSLNAVRCFAVAGRHLNFTAAGAELGVTQGAVSRLMQALEADLGVALFAKQGRNLILTAAGAAYHREVGEAIGQIAAASRAVRRSVEGNVLSINVLPTLAMRWLIPRLPAFQAAHPDIFVDLTAGDGPVDLSSDRAQIAIRLGLPPFGEVVAERLMGEDMAALCAPSRLRPGGGAMAPEDLLRHPLLHHATRPTAWREFLAPFGLEPPDKAPPLSFEHFFMLAEAAAAGMGIALIPLFLAQGELAAGRLVMAMPQTMKPAHAYYLLHRREAGQQRAVRLFKTWIAGEARRMPAAI
jgi:LysR family glycine cleavage system transcriptional activator